jgi:hypothetical protein
MMKFSGIAVLLVAILGSSIASAQSLAGPQKHAARSAQTYLNMSGFSRVGLINQLSSNYGDGYNVADATAAVDSCLLIGMPKRRDPQLNIWKCQDFRATGSSSNFLQVLVITTQEVRLPTERSKPGPVEP